MLHKRKVVIINNGAGDSVYVVFVNDVGYVRRKSSLGKKPISISNGVDYYEHLVESARKVT